MLSKCHWCFAFTHLTRTSFVFIHFYWNKEAKEAKNFRIFIWILADYQSIDVRNVNKKNRSCKMSISISISGNSNKSHKLQQNKIIILNTYLNSKSAKSNSNEALNSPIWKLCIRVRDARAFTQFLTLSLNVSHSLPLQYLFLPWARPYFCLLVLFFSGSIKIPERAFSATKYIVAQISCNFRCICMFFIGFYLISNALYHGIKQHDQ